MYIQACVYMCTFIYIYIYINNYIYILYTYIYIYIYIYGQRENKTLKILKEFPTHVASVFPGSQKDRSNIGTDRIMAFKLWVKFQALCVVEAWYAGVLSWPQKD